MEHILIPTAYLGSTNYYSAIKRCNSYEIELYENYQKQSFRNRTSILGANGVIDLTIPIINEHGKKSLIKDTRIDYSLPWQKIHQRSIMSAYKSSPYYEYYIDKLEPLLVSNPLFLIDYNMALHDSVMQILKFNKTQSLTSEYNIDVEVDFRAKLSAKKGARESDLPHYYQVFSEKLPFVPNLSILDLIFCEGPNAVNYL